MLFIVGAISVANAVGAGSTAEGLSAGELQNQCKQLKRGYSSSLRAIKTRLRAKEITNREAKSLQRELRKEKTDVCKAARNSSASSGRTSLTLSSNSFARGSAIPLKYAYTEAGGQNVSPQFSWTGGGSNIRSYAFLMYDPHPTAQNYVHWCVTGISAGTTSFAEGEQAGTAWTNGYTAGYEGPFPPAGDGVHTYTFKFLGLSTANALNPVDATSGYCTLASFDAATVDSVVAAGRYEATYQQN